MFSAMLCAPVSWLIATCIATSEPTPAPEPATDTAADTAAETGAESAAEPATETDAGTTAEAAAEPPRGFAPPPDQSDGVIVAPSPPRGWALLPELQAALLYLPARVVELMLAPLRTVAWLYERYRLRYWFKRIFFTENLALGVYPVAGYQTAYGLTVGLRAVARGPHAEWFSLGVAYGGQYRGVYRVGMGTGDLLSKRLQLFLGVAVEQRPRDFFFGIGNQDLSSLATAPVPVNAFSGLAFRTRFRMSEVRTLTGLAFRPFERAVIQLSTELDVRWFGPPSTLASNEAYTAAIYDPRTLIGFEQGSARIYTEVAAALDHRRASKFILAPSTGWYSAAFAGYATDVAGAQVSMWRMGTEQQVLFNLYDHSRVLTLQLFLEGVAGSLNRIPFVDLPRLGGFDLLRGYDYDRFRDRLAGVFSAEYRFELNQFVFMALFTDVGRVWGSLGQLTLRDLRVGFGGELRVYVGPLILARLQVSTSVDNVVFFRFSFQPARDLFSRTRQ